MSQEVLDSFSTLKAIPQGYHIGNVVHANRDKLKKDGRGGTVERYRDLPRAVKNVARLARHARRKGNFLPFLIHEKGKNEVLGLATIVLNQTVIHPNLGAIRGDDLDYWADTSLLSQARQDDLHKAVAREIVSRCAKPSALFRRHLFTTVVEGQQFLPLGLIEPAAGAGFIMDPVGEPAVLTMPGQKEDTFGVTRNPATVQVYTGRIV